MSEKLAHVQLAHTRMWVPRVAAKNEAVMIYSEFSHNVGCAEDLAHLSIVARDEFSPEVTKTYFDDALEARLRRRGYLEDQLGDIASRITLKTVVAANMIEADLDDDVVSGHLVEPFVGKQIIPELFEIYLRNRREA